jgi:hypothetical protein
MPYLKTLSEVTFITIINNSFTKYMLMTRHQNAGQNHNIKIANRSFENMAQFKYLGTTVTNQNLIQEEIKAVFTLTRNHGLSVHVKRWCDIEP